MHVFITGGSGLIGSAIVPQLIAAGHQVSALARSDASARKLQGLGATTVQGTHTDLDVLSSASRAADAVLHLAFNHDLMFTGQGAKACEEDRAAISAICDALVESSTQGQKKAFVNSSGTLGSTGPDEYATKPDAPGMERGQSEIITRDYAKAGLHAINIRLAPVVHGPQKEHPFVSTQISVAKKNGYVAYIGDGSQRWSALHVEDAAALYVLALTKGPSGSNFHAVDEEITVKDIASFISKKLGGLEMKSLTTEQATDAGYGFMAMIMSFDAPTTARLTKEWTGWQPKQYGLLKEMEQYSY